MSTMRESVELVPAHLWVCPDCGRDNFVRATRLEPESMEGTEEDEEQAEVTTEELKAFAKLLQIYLSRDVEDREGIVSMASVAIDPNATTDEIEAALDTLRESLYPTESVDLEVDWGLEANEENVSKQMDLEEETFANRLDHFMKAKELTQELNEHLADVGAESGGHWLMAPTRVTCQHCGIEYDVAQEDD